MTRRVLTELRRQAIGVLALFIALGGVAYAAATIRSEEIVDGTIRSQDLAPDSVGYQNTQRIPYLRLWGYHDEGGCTSGVNHDVGFANRSGFWPGGTPAAGFTRTQIFREGKYILTANIAFEPTAVRPESGFTNDSPLPSVSLVAYSPAGARRVLSVQRDPEDVVNAKLNIRYHFSVATTEHLRAGETVAVQTHYRTYANSIPEFPRAPCASDEPGLASPSMTIAWLGR